MEPYNREPDVIEKQKRELPAPDGAILPHEPVYTYLPPEDESAGRAGCARGCLWLTAGIGGCLAMVVVGIGLAVLLGFTSIGALFGGFTAALGGPARAEVVSSRTLVTSMQPLGVLVTFRSETVIEDIRVGVQQNVGNACGIAASHLASGGVEAGIDLARISEDDVTYDAERNLFVVALPPPMLTACRVDSIDQYNRSFTLCPVDWDTVRALASYTALTRFRDDALEGGVLERAAVEGRLVLTNLLQQVSGAAVEIVFQQPAPNADATADGEPMALGASCFPQPPDGWRIDPNTGGWTR